MKHLCQASLIVGALVDPPLLPWLVYAYGPDGFAQERPVGRNTSVMSYPFLDGTQVVSSLSFLAPFNLCPNKLFFKIQPTIQVHKELVWFAGNLKLEVIEYFQQLYGGQDASDDDDDDDDDADDDNGGGDGGGGLESAPSYQLRKRHFR